VREALLTRYGVRWILIVDRETVGDLRSDKVLEEIAGPRHERLLRVSD
jgi:hypothetical protein